MDITLSWNVSSFPSKVLEVERGSSFFFVGVGVPAWLSDIVIYIVGFGVGLVKCFVRAQAARISGR